MKGDPQWIFAKDRRKASSPHFDAESKSNQTYRVVVTTKRGCQLDGLE